MRTKTHFNAALATSLASDAAQGASITQRFGPSPGFARTAAAQGSFAVWLRELSPLEPGSAVTP
jgi:hypothetical protein